MITNLLIVIKSGHTDNLRSGVPELDGVIMVQAVLFEDIFDVRVLNENGKKFEKG